MFTWLKSSDFCTVIRVSYGGGRREGGGRGWEEGGRREGGREGGGRGGGGGTGIPLPR